MKILIDDILLNYEVTGFGRPLILLHGWGLDMHTFDNLANQLNEDYTIYKIDLPGFGLSEINKALSIEEYANIINEFCLSLAIINPIIVGHSFGGRLAIKYSSLYPINKLVLISSPGIRGRFNLLKYLKIRMYKLCKKLSIKNNFGSKDYKNAQPILKEVLLKAVNTYLDDDLRKIKCPTLLIYGKKDKDVKVYIGRKMKELISDSKYFEIKRCGHFPYIDRFRFVLIVLKSFLHGEEI